ncbi:hypothetical protein C8R45DRAFT_1108906 [Mycena sanguinolenta]|nr:hypothetical protein C8R45DRAFT_1108906 [Mycena sanguinolenta]
MAAVLSTSDNYEAYARAKADGCFPTVELECAAWDQYFPTVELKLEALELEFPVVFPGDVLEPIATTITPLSESSIATVFPIVIRSSVRDGTLNETDTAPEKLPSPVLAHKDDSGALVAAAFFALGSGNDKPIVRSTRHPAPPTQSSSASGEPITRTTAAARQETSSCSSSSASSSVMRSSKANCGMEDVYHSTESTIPKPSSVIQPQTTSSNPIQGFQSVAMGWPPATENSQLDIEMSRSPPPPGISGTSTTASAFAPIQRLESVVMPPAATGKSQLVNEDIEMSCSPPPQETSSGVWGSSCAAAYKVPAMNTFPSSWIPVNQPSYNIFSSFTSSHVFPTPSAQNPHLTPFSPTFTPPSIFELMRNEPPSHAAYRRPNAYVIPPVAIPQHLWQQQVIREKPGGWNSVKPRRSRLPAPYFLRTPLVVAKKAKKARAAFSSTLYNDNTTDISLQQNCDEKPPGMPSTAPAPSARTTWMYCNGHKLSSPPPFRQRVQRFKEPTGGLFEVLTSMFWSYLIPVE